MMLLFCYVSAAVAALLHIGFFLVESIFWGHPASNKSFGMSAKDAQATRVWAFNQGFYNLFLAIAVGVGIGFELYDKPHIAMVLTSYACASMLGAGIVLRISDKRLAVGALVQALPPLLALVGFATLVFG